MNYFSPRTLLIAALFGIGAVTPFLPAAHRKSNQFALEVRMSSTLPSSIQVYYDDGRGFRETASTRIPLDKNVTPRSYRLVIPAGTYRQFRFDPTESAGSVVIESAQLIDKQGNVLRVIPLSEIKALSQIKSRSENAGKLEIVPEKDANDAQLLIVFNPT